MVSGIILAGGSSTRYGTGENKTLVELLGRPVLEYSLRVFLAADVVDEVVLAAKAGEEAALRKLAEGLCLQKPVTVVTGGADRAASVENALAAARGEVVLIQDGARPLVTERMLEDCLAALEEADGATIATPSRDTVKKAMRRRQPTAAGHGLSRRRRPFTGRSCWRCTGHWAMGQKEAGSRMTACCWSAPADG